MTEQGAKIRMWAFEQSAAVLPTGTPVREIVLNAEEIGRWVCGMDMLHPEAADWKRDLWTAHIPSRKAA